MAKFYRRRFSRAGSRNKYSIEQRSFYNTTNASGDLAIQVVLPTTLEGMRKVKHLTVNLTCENSRNALYWALVYVPHGTSPSPLSITGSSMYEPNQFVMNAGIVDSTAGPIRFHAPVSRNLNSGDTIYLIMHDAGGAANVEIFGVVRYAVTLN